MSNWEIKDGYDTKILATASELNAPGVEIQLFRFRKGKFNHYHKKKTEFFYFTAGIGKVILDGEERSLFTGSELFVLPGVRHTFVNESEELLLEGIMTKTNSDPNDTFFD